MEIKFKQKDIVRTMARLDDKYCELQEKVKAPRTYVDVQNIRTRRNASEAVLISYSSCMCVHGPYLSFSVLT